MAPTPSEPRERLLRTAAGLFYSEGIGRVGIDRLVTQANVTRATFYRHFPSKDDLVVAYLRAEDQRLRAGVDQMLAAGPAPADALRNIANAIGESICLTGFRGCPFINAAAEYPEPQHPVRLVVSDHRAWFLQTITAIIEKIAPAQAELAGRQFVMMRDGSMVAGYTEEPPVAARSLREGTENLLVQLGAKTSSPDEDHEFSKPRTVDKLFGFGVRFVSRSEAKRLMRGLERFTHVTMDFTGIEEVGQGFVDEIFRVWPKQHPDTVVEPIGMVGPVEFMVRRGLGRHP